MRKTKNLGLNMPEPQDYVNIDDLNENAKILDAAILKKVDLLRADIIAGRVELALETTGSEPITTTDGHELAAIKNL